MVSFRGGKKKKKACKAKQGRRVLSVDPKLTILRAQPSNLPELSLDEWDEFCGHVDFAISPLRGAKSLRSTLNGLGLYALWSVFVLSHVYPEEVSRFSRVMTCAMLLGLGPLCWIVGKKVQTKEQHMEVSLQVLCDRWSQRGHPLVWRAGKDIKGVWSIHVSKVRVTEPVDQGENHEEAVEVVHIEEDEAEEMAEEEHEESSSTSVHDDHVSDDDEESVSVSGSHSDVDVSHSDVASEHDSHADSVSQADSDAELKDELETKEDVDEVGGVDNGEVGVEGTDNASLLPPNDSYIVVESHIDEPPQDGEGKDPEDVAFIMARTGCSPDVATKELRDGDLADMIEKLPGAKTATPTLND